MSDTNIINKQESDSQVLRHFQKSKRNESRTMVILTIVSVVCIGLAVYHSHSMMQKLIRTSDHAVASAHTNHLQKLFENDVNEVKSHTRDYANWTEMYNFVQHWKDKKEVDPTLYGAVLGDSLNNTGMSFVAVVENSGTPIAVIPQNIADSLPLDAIATKRQSGSGYLLVDDKVYCVAIEVITEHSGTLAIFPKRADAFVIIGRAINEPNNEGVSTIINIWDRVDQKNYEGLPTDTTSFLKTSDNNGGKTHSYIVLRDIFGYPAAEVHSIIHSGIMETGRWISMMIEMVSLIIYLVLFILAAAAVRMKHAESPFMNVCGRMVSLQDDMLDEPSEDESTQS